MKTRVFLTVLALGTVILACGCTEKATKQPAPAVPAAPGPSQSTEVQPVSASPLPQVHTVRVRGSLLVVRHHTKRDALWLVTPASGRARLLYRLPFRAATAEVSPDRRLVAYLPEPPDSGRWTPGIAVVTANGSCHRYRLPNADFRFVDAASWVSPTLLVLSGRPKAGYEDQPLTDRIGFLDVSTGETSAGFPGAEPSAAAGLLTYATFTDAGSNGQFSGRRQVERLMLRDLSTGSQREIGQGLLEGEYGGIRYFSHARLSPNGGLLFSCGRGHQAAMGSFELRILSTGALLFHYECVGDVQSAWDDESRHLAFVGLMGNPSNTGPVGVWVYDTQTGILRRSRLRISLVDGLSFSPAGDLAFANGTVFIARGGDPRRIVRLMRGDLPVWVR